MPRTVNHSTARADWTRSQRVKNATIALLIGIAYVAARPVARRLPKVTRRALELTLWSIARLLHFTRVSVAMKAAKSLARQQEQGVPLRSSALHRRLSRTFAEIALDVLAPEHQAYDAFAPEAEGMLQGLRSSAAPSMIVSLHLGNWERVGRSLAKELPTFAAVTRRAYDPRLDVYFTRLRGYPTIAISTRVTENARALMKHLRQGGILGVPMDVRTRAPSLEVRMLGRPARLPIGPVRLVKRLRTRLWVASLAPHGADGESAVDLEELSVDGDEATVLQRIADAFSCRIRALPDHWLWPAAPFVDDQA
jgi:Bacterial lipid A biosynthesis acyltransferase